jgi:hypothetical protein
MDVVDWYSISNLGPKTSCSVIHPTTSCPIELITKFLTVVQKSSKLYAALYLVMFSMEFRKLKMRKSVKRSLLVWCKDFLLSLVFMSWMVGGFKMTLCILNGIGSTLDGMYLYMKGYSAILMSLIGSTSIFITGKSKRG